MTCRIIILLWVGYLLMLLSASLASGVRTSVVQWCILCTKFLFFLLLLFYANRRFVEASLRIYSNVMFATVLCALGAAAAVLLGVSSFGPLDVGGRMAEVFGGAFYVTNTPICPPLQVFRIQGLTEEPGTYAFALLPALFWFVVVARAYGRAACIVLGLTLSMSLGAGVFLILALALLLSGLAIARWRRAGPRENSSLALASWLTVAVIAIVGIYAVAGQCTKRFLGDTGNVAARTIVEGCMVEHKSDRATCEWRAGHAMSTTPSGKTLSFHDRAVGVQAVIDLLKVQPLGTGTALGMLTARNSIAVGYAVAVLEAGILGGICYMLLFTVMGGLVAKMIFSAPGQSQEDKLKLALALGIASVLVMGAQRVQPDLSFWHTWLYAAWFCLAARPSDVPDDLSANDKAQPCPA